MPPRQRPPFRSKSPFAAPFARSDARSDSKGDDKKRGFAKRGDKRDAPRDGRRDEKSRDRRDEKAKPAEGRNRRDHRNETPRYKARDDKRFDGGYGEKRFSKLRDFTPGAKRFGDKSGDRGKRAPEQPAFTLRDGNSVLIWGLHAVRAAWLNPQRRCHRLWLTESSAPGFDATIAEARDTLLLKRPDPKRVDRHELDRMTLPGSVHQGIVMEAAIVPEPSLADIIGGDNPPDLLIMLDQVTDPHNVGAILRSAAAFGAGAVILTERNAPTTTGVLAKSASGALEHVPQIHVVNLARTLDELHEAGYWSVGLAEEGEKDLGALDLSGRTVLVMGAEGEGLRQLTRKKCNELARLPTGGAIGSLNVSNAAAVGLYEVRRQKKSFG